MSLIVMPTVVTDTLLLILFLWGKAYQRLSAHLKTATVYIYSYPAASIVIEMFVTSSGQS